MNDGNCMSEDIHINTQKFFSQHPVTYESEREETIITKNYLQNFNMPQAYQKFVNTVILFCGKYIITEVSQWKISHLLLQGYHRFSSRYSIRYCKSSDVTTRPRIPALLKALKIAGLTSYTFFIPGVDALSDFDLKKSVPAVYSQLAQNAIVASFGVLCSGDGGRPPLSALPHGPLSSISSAVWLWRVRADSGNELRYWSFEEFEYELVTTPGGIMKQSAIEAMPGIAAVFVTYTMYFLSFLESHEWRWALTVSGAGLASEGSRLLATWLAAMSVESVYKMPSDLEGDNLRFHVTSEGHNRSFIEYHDGKLRPTIRWQRFTEMNTTVKCSLGGHAEYTWQWNNIEKAILSFLLFFMSAILAIFSTGALVASEDSSLIGGFLSFMICYCATGKLKSDVPTDAPHPDVYKTMLSATRIGMIVGMICESTPSEMTSRDFVTYSLLCKSGTLTYDGKKYQAYIPERRKEIEMHEIYRRYAELNPVISRIFDSPEEYNGGFVMLEIADALYCRAILLIRHVHSCRCKEPSVRGRVCNVDTGHFLSGLLLVSDHIECPNVFALLNGIRSWMNHEQLLWSIIGAKVTLEMMVLPHLKAQLESSNTLDLALRICHMAMYENVPSGDMLEAVPTALYYLLTGKTVLGHATARVVENAIEEFGTANILPDLNEVVLRLDDNYTIHCKAKLHPWPGGFIPILVKDAVTDQPANYNMAHAAFYKMLNRQALHYGDTPYFSRLTIT